MNNNINNLDMNIYKYKILLIININYELFIINIKIIKLFLKMNS